MALLPELIPIREASSPLIHFAVHVRFISIIEGTSFWLAHSKINEIEI